MVKCNSCGYNGRLKFEGSCPVCNSADVSEMSIYEVALKEARALKDQNIIAVDLLKSRAKSRNKALRLKSYL